MNGSELVQLVQALNDAFTPDEFSTLLLGLNRKLTDYAAPINPFPHQLNAVIAAASSQVWLPQLMSEVLKQRPNNQRLKDFIAVHPGWDTTQHAGDPCDALRIFGGRSFVGRAAFRKHLRKMMTACSKNVLLVRSEGRKVGKTYSKELISYVSVRYSSRFAYLDLDREEYDPGKLALYIAKQIGIDVSGIPARGQEQAARWNQALSNWLIPDLTAPDGRVCWIVLDGFRERMPSEEVQDLIAQIAQRAQSTQDYRVILINYTYSLPIVIRGFMFTDGIKAIEKEEVLDHLRQVHRLRFGSAPGEEQLRDYVDGVYEEIAELVRESPEMRDDHALLNVAVTKVADEIEQG